MPVSYPKVDIEKFLQEATLLEKISLLGGRFSEPDESFQEDLLMMANGRI